MVRREIFMALLAGIFCASKAYADEPLQPPYRHQVTSPDKRAVAISDPKTGTKIVDAATGKELWSMPGWFRWLFVSNDGQHLATGYDGMNLIPVNYNQDIVLITFWERGRKVKTIALRNISPDASSLRRTVSHYRWGDIEGVNEHNQLVVTRADGRQYRFNIATGAAE